MRDWHLLSFVGFALQASSTPAQDVTGTSLLVQRENAWIRLEPLGASGLSTRLDLVAARTGGTVGGFTLQATGDRANGDGVPLDSLTILQSHANAGGNRQQVVFSLDQAFAPRAFFPGKVEVGSSLAVQNGGASVALRPLGSSGLATRLELVAPSAGGGGEGFVFQALGDRPNGDGAKTEALTILQDHPAALGSRQHVVFSLSETFQPQAYFPGKVGIGSASPIHPLEVLGHGGALAHFEDDGTPGAHSVLEIKSTQPNGSIAINFLNAAGGADGQISYRPNDDHSLVMRTAGAERLRIDSNGSVGIGTAAPQRPLHVHGAEVHVSGAFGGYSFNDRSAGPEFDSGPQGGSRWELYASGGSARLWSSGDKLVVDPAGNVTALGKLSCQIVEIRSDRHAKNVQGPVDSSSVLARLVEMPIYRWSFTNAPTEEHLGPMAQDFRAAFQLGNTETHIALADEVGVGLAAIQELHSQLETALQEKDEEIDHLRAECARLREQGKADQARLSARLEAIERSLAGGSTQNANRAVPASSAENNLAGNP